MARSFRLFLILEERMGTTHEALEGLCTQFYGPAASNIAWRPATW